MSFIVYFFKKRKKTRFDLVEVQIMQTRVEQSDAALINAAEYSTSSLFSTIPLVVAVVFSEADKFVFLVVGSALAVLTAAVLFSVYSLKQRRAAPTILPTLPDEDNWKDDENDTFGKDDENDTL